MKKLLYILIAVAIVACCDKPAKEKTFAEKVSGEWHCSAAEPKADIYVNFTAEGVFELYQQITEGAYRLYRGTWSVADETQKVITGKYNDGEEWASDYIVNFTGDDSMTLQPTESTGVIEYLYEREAIPEEVKETCAVMVKSPYAY